MYDSCSAVMTKKHDSTFKMTLPPTVRGRQTLLLTWTFFTKKWGQKSTKNSLASRYSSSHTTHCLTYSYPSYSVCKILQNHSRKPVTTRNGYILQSNQDTTEFGPRRPTTAPSSFLNQTVSFKQLLFSEHVNKPQIISRQFNRSKILLKIFKAEFL